MSDTWYRTADGALIAVHVQAPEDEAPIVPSDATELTEQEYLDARAQAQQDAVAAKLAAITGA